MKTPCSREQLAAACEEELRRLGLPVQWLDAAVDGEHWAVTLTAAGRTFHFGTLAGPRYCFEERTTAQPIDFVSRSQAPGSRAPEVLWAYSFFLLHRALADPMFRGIDGRPL